MRLAEEDGTAADLEGRSVEDPTPDHTVETELIRAAAQVPEEIFTAL